MTSVHSLNTLGSFGTELDQPLLPVEDEPKVIPKLDPKYFEQEQLDQEAEVARRCNCTLPFVEHYLQDWELYRPQSLYINSNISTKPSSSTTLRRLVTDRSLKRVINGRPTALGRLIAGMKKVPPPSKYEYGNCLRYLLEIDEYKNQDNFFLKQVVKHIPKTNDTDCYLRSDDKAMLSRRRNPFRELQLCPKSMYDLTQQPPKQEVVRRDGTLTNLFLKKPLNDYHSSTDISLTAIDQGILQNEAGTDHEEIARAKNQKCRCITKKNDLVLDNWEIFSLAHVKDREAVKTSAARTIQQVESEMATPSKISGRSNILMKWIETRGYEPLPDDYECKECLEVQVKFDPFEKQFELEKEPIDRETRDGIFIPKPVMRQSFRRNPFKENQLCPHLLDKIMDLSKEQMKFTRGDNLIDWIRKQAALNDEPEEARAGARRVDSLFFEAIFKSINKPKSSHDDEEVQDEAPDGRRSTLLSSSSPS